MNQNSANITTEQLLYVLMRKELELIAVRDRLQAVEEQLAELKNEKEGVGDKTEKE